MIQDQVKQELDQRGWSILKLSQETGIRYPSLTEWFKGKKGLDSTNLEKILKALELTIINNMKNLIKVNSDDFWKQENVNSFKSSDFGNKYGTIERKKGFTVFRFSSNGYINKFHGAISFVEKDNVLIPTNFEDAERLYEIGK